MIRLLHFADLHLGVENYGGTDPVTGLRSRLMDFLRAFDAVVEHAIGEEVDLVVFAGDAFKSRDPSPTHQREFARRIRRLSEAGIPTILLVGNHDLPNALTRAHAIEIFDTLRTPHVHVIERPAFLTVETRRGAPLQVVGVPWVTRSHLLTREASRGLSLEELNEQVEAGVRRIIEGLSAQVVAGEPAIMVAHGTVPGAVWGAERSVLLGQDVLLPADLLRDPRYDYVALGHIHKHQIVHDEPPVLYSGSVERIDFGEAKEEKGFIVAEIGDGPADWSFVPTPTRPLKEIRIDVRQASDPMAVIEAGLAAHQFEDAVVKLVIRATPENEGRLESRKIHRLLAGAAHVAAIVRDVERPVRLRLGSAREIAAATPRDLLRRYLEAKQVEPAWQKTLLAHAEQIFDEDGEQP